MSERFTPISDSKIVPPCQRNGINCSKRCVGCRKTCSKWKVYQYQKRQEENAKNEYQKLKVLAEQEARRDYNRERRERAKELEMERAYVW